MGSEQSQPDIFGPPIKDILSPQKGTMYSNSILKRTLQIHDEDFAKKLMDFFKIKKQRMNSPVYLKVHSIQVDNDSLLCGTSKLIHIFVDFPEMTLSNEIRKKRINQLPFTSNQLRETYHLLLDALALYQELGIYYHNLSIDTLYFDRNIKIMDPYIFDLKAIPLRHYRDPQNQIGYQNLVWSFGVILLEMYHLQPVPQIYREQYVDWNQISKLVLAIQNEVWLSHILSIIFQEYRPNFLELRQIPLDIVAQQQQQYQQQYQQLSQSQQPQQKQQQQLQQQQQDKIVTSQPSYQSLVQPTIKLLKVPCEGRGSLKERIESIKANYFPQSYTYRESADKNYDSRSTISAENFKEEMRQRHNQTVDLKSDPFMKDRESDINTISKADQNEEYICETYADGAIYEGFKKNFLKNGQGSLYYADSSFYIGQWKNDKINGFGSLYYPTGKLAYQGFWVDEKFHGKGILFNENPKGGNINYKNLNQIGEGWISYSGMFVNDQKHGKGVMTFTNGDRFEGGFQYNQISGAGQYKECNGNEIKGIWKQNLFI